MLETDTICALSTPAGPGGIAVIRLSGSRAKDIYGAVFRPAGREAPEERRLLFGHLADGADVIDEAMAVFFTGPKSYTGEDMAELHCHGGRIPVKRALDLLLKNGARMAEPGEFTRRAFLNGKMDLSRAEAVMSYISALSEAGAKVAVNQMEGALYRKITALQDKLTDISAGIEAVIEYPEEDFSPDLEKPLISKIVACKDEILSLAMTFDEGRILKEGFNVAIAGKPNVGKSSLLNALLGSERAIVTEIPGTTRDVIEDVVSLKGLPVRFFDTAGIRETEDIVERFGVKRSYETLQKADLILLVIDLSEGLTDGDREIFEAFRDRNILVVLNKSDIRQKGSEEEIIALFGEKKMHTISAVTGEGLSALMDILYGEAVKDEKLLEGVVITSERHKAALFKAAKSLSEAMDAYFNGLTLDCVAVDVKSAWSALGEITGVTVTEEIINRIFENFCLGK